MLRDYPQDYFKPPWLSRPSVGCGNNVKKRPPQMCTECGFPLPEVRSHNQVAHAGACQDARKARTYKNSLAQLNRKRKAEKCNALKKPSTTTAPPRR